jgi:hypothetical protein
VYPAFEIQMVNPTLIARGGIISIHPGSLNPSAILENDGFCFRSDYTNLFGIKGLHSWDANIEWGKYRLVGIGLHTNACGNDLYQESMLSLSYCRSIKEVISVGGSAVCYNVAIAGDYDSYRAIGISIGSKFFVSDDLRLALLFQNVNAPKLYKDSNDIPETFTFGVQWFPHSKIELNAELYKDTIFPFSTRFGIVIEIFKGVRGLVGVQLNPERYSGGISCKWRNIQFDAAILHHAVLPYTYYFGCGVRI